ncbi:zf-HC2 domain-containing protein [Microtetraspora sp. AC03309]|uniref:sigma factor n=1 Tax=Microtetraspora sp. AC03309 TaxID=2779376 RepID=UPI001E3D9AEA|nr:sigma factor [Microtetraspora sp. AC03309]MCC5577187.1 zf-HC2 domain-containing protein [Microtetraspora sp. AC03309]
MAAYAPLFDRHVAAARSLAGQMVEGDAEAEDIVSETFAAVLNAIRSGGGPESAFRPYLLTALRRTAAGETDEDALGTPYVDPAYAGLERSLVATAYFSLPERWRMVLWHTEVEACGAGEIALMLGLSVKGVATLAYRAREGLRQAFLQIHLDGGPLPGCRVMVEKMAAYVRGGLTRRETRLVDGHVADCVDCRTVFLELSDVVQGLRVVVGPLVAGPFLTGYLAALRGAAAAGGGGRTGVVRWVRRVPLAYWAAAAGTAAAAAGGLFLSDVVIGGGHPSAQGVHDGRGSYDGHGSHDGRDGSGGDRGTGGTGGTGGDRGNGGTGGTGGTGGDRGNGGTGGTGDHGVDDGHGRPQPVPSPPVVSPPAPSPPVPSPTGLSPSGRASAARSPEGPSHPGVPPLSPFHRSSPAASPAASVSVSPVPSSSASPAPSGGARKPGGTTPEPPVVERPFMSKEQAQAPVPRVARLAATVEPVGGLVRARRGIVAVRLRNTGNAASQEVEAAVDLPKGVVPATVGGRRGHAASAETADGWACRTSGKGVRCAHDALAAGQATSLFLPVNVSGDAPEDRGPTVRVRAGTLRAAATSAKGVRASGATARFATDGHVTGQAVGNALSGCPQKRTTCTEKVLVDLDKDPATRSSSPARLTLPSRSRVLWAGLYWSAGGEGTAPAGDVRVRAPRSRHYVTVHAAEVSRRTLPTGTGYLAFADVTGLVRAGGPAGVWWVADASIRTGPSRVSASGGRASDGRASDGRDSRVPDSRASGGAKGSAGSAGRAGWTLVVVASDPQQPYGQAAVLETASLLRGGGPLNVTLGGLAAGGRQAKLDVLTWPGKAGPRRDSVTLRGQSSVLNILTRKDALLFGVAAISVPALP